MQRVAVIGNGGGGKSTLSRLLADRHGLPLTEVDQLQYGPAWEVVDRELVARRLREVQAGERWLIDGFGPMDVIDERFRRADTLVYVDFPLWIHFWWAAERQIALHAGELDLGRPPPPTERLFEAIWRVHQELKPQLDSWVERERGRATVHHLRSPAELEAYSAPYRA